MASDRITVRVPKQIDVLLRSRCRATGQTRSDLIRAALEAFLARPERAGSAYDVAAKAGLIGCVKGAPKTLSTNGRKS
jgi:Arc/MetJ-type ribon-helix-helix transcriptional regulator